MSLSMQPVWMRHWSRSHPRIACGAPCGVFVEHVRRPGTIWNLGAAGLYVVMPEPLPALDTRVVLTFLASGRTDVHRVSRSHPLGQCAVHLQGCGSTKPSLPPGCGVEFVETGHIGPRTDRGPYPCLRRPALVEVSDA
jgi:hypothetical protein